MNINIRNYIKNNFKDCSSNDIKDSIIESIKSNDEVVLPGLGVLFEIVWNNSSDDIQKEILKILKESLI